ncbi:hypothetical protein EMCRGX_G001155 [Ephydatia muelleri]
MEKRKGKAGKGKQKNKFRFESFNERIGNIKIDVVHRVGQVSETPEDRETFFYESLQKWHELNCTQHFVVFYQEVRGITQLLTQLVHHKDTIIGSLVKHLQVKDSLAYEPLLDLVVQLARDLHQDFYPHFPSLFTHLVALSNIHDPHVIQCVFNTLEFLFKFLWRYMLLMGSQKPHIRRFATESFGFLIRKVKDQEWFFRVVFMSMASSPELAEGVGHLLFEVCKGVETKFHSCTTKVCATMSSPPALHLQTDVCIEYCAVCVSACEGSPTS